MTILGIIPASIGSKRIPNKNFVKIGSRSLTKIALDQAKNSELLSEIVVSTDLKNPRQEFDAMDLRYIIKRPDNLCGDLAKGYTYVQHALQYLRDVKNLEFEYFVVLPPTAPLRSTKDIDACIQILLKNDVDSVTSMVEVNQMYNPLKLKTITKGRIQPYYEEENGRTAYYELPKAYVRNCAVYASKVSVLEGESLIGKICMPYIMPPERSIDINEPIDLEVARCLVERNSDQWI